MIEARSLTKTFGTSTAIENVSFSIKSGEIVGFLGPNGAGKTTTMRILTGYFPATTGTAKVAGYDIFNDSLKARERVGYLPENPPVYREMTVTSYLDFVARIRGVPKGEIAARKSEVLASCGIADVAHRLIGNLSKGYRQRVGLAQALIHRPEVLILDEPTVGLDPKQIKEIRDLIKGLRGSRTIVLSTHILSEVSATCDRVIIINEGRVVATDTLDELSARTRHTRKIEVLVRRLPETLVASLERLDGAIAVTVLDGPEGTRRLLVETKPAADLREQVGRTVFAADAGLLELAVSSVSLEDVFVRLTTDEKEGKRA
ncbi:MAG: ATP-binding cassette domain-containing protein [Acidobacteriota bacterium]